MRYTIGINRYLDNADAPRDYAEEGYYVIYGETSNGLKALPAKRIYLPDGCVGKFEVDSRFERYKIFMVATNSLVRNFNSDSNGAYEKRLIIDKVNIEKNNKEGKELSVVTLFSSNKVVRHAMGFQIDGPSRLLYDETASPRFWVETSSPVTLIGEIN